MTKLISVLLIVLSVPDARKYNSKPSGMEIRIDNIKMNQGIVVIELYSEEKNWLKKPDYQAKISPTQESLTVTIDAPAKSYAVSVYQDLNSKGKLDQGFFGIPTEPVGFGNNYKPMGQPNFKSAKVDFKENKVIPVIRLYKVF